MLPIAAGFAVLGMLLFQLVLIYSLAPNSLREDVVPAMGLESLHPGRAVYNNQVVATDSKTTDSKTVLPTSPSTLHTVSEPTEVIKTRTILELTESFLIKRQGIKLKWIAMRMNRSDTLIN